MKLTRRRLILTSALLAAGLPPAGLLRAQLAAPWRDYQSEEGRFKVSFPGEPVTKRGKLRTESGELPSTWHTAGDGVDATYDVRYTDYPGAVTGRLTPAKMLAAARDGLIAQSKGRLESDNPVGMGKVAGRDLQITGEDGMHYRFRLLLVEHRLYQLTAMARPPARADEDRFFASFQLIGFPRQ